MNDDVVISRYTDEQAVDDGVLVKVGPRDRVTRAVWDFFVQHTPLGPQPPPTWPVDLRRWFGGQGTEAERDTKAAALAVGILAAHGAAARRVYEQNSGGGIWKCRAVVRDGVLARLEVDAEQARPAGAGGTTLWLMPNELGGLTVLFPEDY